MSQQVSASAATSNLVNFRNIHHISPELESEFQKCSSKGFVGPVLVNQLLYRFIAMEPNALAEKLACEILAHGELTKLVEVDARYGEKKFTPLILTSYLGKVEVVAALIQRNATVNLRTEKGNTALMSAALNKKLDPSKGQAIAQIFNRHCAQINEPIYLGAFNQEVTSIELILKNGSLSADSVEAAKRLTEMGVNINEKIQGENAFGRALARGAYDWLPILQQLGCKPKVSFPYDYHYPDSTNTLLIELGAKWESWKKPRNLEQVRILLSQGLKPEKTDNLLNLDTPCLNLLSQHGFDLSFKATGRSDVLEMSSNLQHFEFMLTLGYPVSPKAFGNYYFLGPPKTHLLDVLQKTRPPTLEEITASILVANDQGRQYGDKRPYTRLLVYLIGRVQSPLDPQDESISPLIYASIQEGMTEVIEALLRRGASLDYRSNVALDPREMVDESFNRIRLGGNLGSCWGHPNLGNRFIPSGSPAVEAARLARRRVNFDFLKRLYIGKIANLFPPQSGMIRDLVNIIEEFDGRLNFTFALKEEEEKNALNQVVVLAEHFEKAQAHHQACHRLDIIKLAILPPDHRKFFEESDSD